MEQSRISHFQAEALRSCPWTVQGGSLHLMDPSYVGTRLASWLRANMLTFFPFPFKHQNFWVTPYRGS